MSGYDFIEFLLNVKTDNLAIQDSIDSINDIEAEAFDMIMPDPNDWNKTLDSFKNQKQENKKCECGAHIQGFPQAGPWHADKCPLFNKD